MQLLSAGRSSCHQRIICRHGITGKLRSDLQNNPYVGLWKLLAVHPTTSLISAIQPCFSLILNSVHTRLRLDYTGFMMIVSLEANCMILLGHIMPAPLSFFCPKNHRSVPAANKPIFRAPVNAYSSSQCRQDVQVQAWRSVQPIFLDVQHRLLLFKVIVIKSAFVNLE